MADGGGVQALNHPSGEEGREMFGADFLRLALLLSGYRCPFPLQLGVRAPELFLRRTTYDTQWTRVPSGCGLFSGPCAASYTL